MVNEWASIPLRRSVHFVSILWQNKAWRRDYYLPLSNGSKGYYSVQYFCSYAHAVSLNSLERCIIYTTAVADNRPYIYANPVHPGYEAWAI